MSGSGTNGSVQLNLAPYVCPASVKASSTSLVTGSRCWCKRKVIRACILTLGLFFTSVLVALACGGLSEAEKHYNAGVDLQEQDQLEEAIAEYHESIRLNPELALAYSNRGLAYDDLGQHQRAIQDYDEGIRRDPELALAYNNRGNAYRNWASPSERSRTTMKPSG